MCDIFSDEMGILNVDLNNINLDDINFNEDDPKTTIRAILKDCCNKFEQRKAFGRYKQRINASSMASYKMVGLVHARR